MSEAAQVLTNSLLELVGMALLMVVMMSAAIAGAAALDRTGT